MVRRRRAGRAPPEPRRRLGLGPRAAAAPRGGALPGARRPRGRAASSARPRARSESGCRRSTLAGAAPGSASARSRGSTGSRSTSRSRATSGRPRGRAWAIAVRGGLVDVFPSTGREPLRVELFGDEIEQIPRSPRSPSVPSTPRTRLSCTRPENGAATSTSRRCRTRGEGSAVQVPATSSGGRPARRISSGAPRTCAGHGKRTGSRRSTLRRRRSSIRSRARRRTPSRRAARDRRPWSERGGERARRAGPLRESRRGSFAHVGEAQRQAGLLSRSTRPAGAGRGAARRPRCTVRRRPRAPWLRLARTRHRAPARTQVFRKRPPRADARLGQALASFAELRLGDYVVHEDHGVGKLLGFDTKEVAGVTRDYLHLAFRGEDRLFVPHEQVGKLSRYIGADASAPALSRLGGKAWQNLKARARASVRELAGELLQLYAQRQRAEGTALCRSRAIGWSGSRRRSLTGRPTTSSARSRRSRRTSRHRARWTGWSAATSASARPRSPSGRPSPSPSTGGPGARAVPDDDPRRAALEHLPGAVSRLPGAGGDDLSFPPPRRGEAGAARVRARARSTCSSARTGSSRAT